MNKELARYFVKLIAENLQFSFNGMGIPSYSCEWLENQFIQENFNEIEEFIKKRYDEHENASKKKRKFRAMTYMEYCKSQCFICEDCYFAPNWADKHCKHICQIWKKSPNDFNKPCRLPNGKYIFIEVKE